MLTLLTYSQTALGNMLAWASNRMRNEDGAVATEYVLLLTFIAIAIIAVVTLFGQDLVSLFTNSCNTLNAANAANKGAVC
jgi:Flp pilus assembly pilin Flp